LDRLGSADAGNELYERILPALLEDHTRNFAGAPTLFHQTFFDREQEAARFRGLLSSSTELDRTILITGSAGVGKTSFVYRIAFDPDPRSDISILPILADYKAAAPQNSDGCLLGFIRTATEQFARVKQPLKGLLANTVGNMHYNNRIVYDHIGDVARSSQTPRVTIFLDDFDYAEQDWFILLDHFLPFVQSAYCSVVLTMRPRLLASLQAYDERLRFYFGRNVQHITLNPLAAREVLASRLAPVLLEHATKSTIGHIVSSFKKSRPLETIAKQLGIERLEDLKQINFPFTEKHNDFMHRISNGNLREVLNIAIDSLLFMIKNRASLQLRVEQGIERTVIGRENTLRLFYENERARFQIININKYRSKSGNSLLYNALEALKIYPSVDERLFDVLSSFGHSRTQVQWAVNFLAEKSQRLIDVKWLLPDHRKSILLLADEYELTEKGNYYLDIAAWDEYVRRAGSIGESVIQSLKPI